MATVQRRLVHKQFNSPIALYSDNNVKETLDRELKVLSSGAVGIDFDDPNTTRSGMLAKSAVLAALEEEERVNRGHQTGLKRVAWPPPPDSSDEAVEEQQQQYVQPPVQQQHQQYVLPPTHQIYHPEPQKQFAPVQQPQQPQYLYQQPQEPAGQQNFQPVPTQTFKPVAGPPKSQIYQPTPFTGNPLRKEAPIHQRPAPVFASQPVAAKFQGGVNMRGDQKWPPVEYKQQAVEENEQRKQIALGPAFRPKRVNKDYTPFFAQNALNATYPGYKAPPGTQHIGNNN